MDAYDIALSSLRSCYSERGIYAGLGHFRDYWARDSFFASLGSISAGDFSIVRKNLSLFLGYVKRDGQLPLRIGRSDMKIVLALMGIGSGDEYPIYRFRKSIPTDQNSLFVISLHSYVKKSGDYAFFRQNIERAEKIMQWNFMMDRDNDFLMEEEGYCTWADSIRKSGKTLYTNVCHLHALSCISELFSLIGQKPRAAEYKKKSLVVKNKINELFWTGEHYADWIQGEKIYNYFSTEGNMLAILWDVADNIKARHIEECSHIFDINEVPSVSVHPPYPSRIISPRVKIAGILDYHNGLSWLWLGCINALAKDKIGMKKEAATLMKKIEELIIRHNEVYEIYDEAGMPVRRILYKSERPFAWSAGLYVYAAKNIKGQTF